jgi:hypothetical protein
MLEARKNYFMNRAWLFLMNASLILTVPSSLGSLKLAQCVFFTAKQLRIESELPKSFSFSTKIPRLIFHPTASSDWI